MRRRRRQSVLLALIFLVALTAQPVWAWLAAGHARMTHAALAALPPTLPAFFRQAGDAMAGVSLDPDAFRGPEVPELTVEEGPEHFFDLELVHGQGVPPNRYMFLRLCEKLKLSPNQVGMLPYAITEWTQRLAVAFAHYRRWPNDPGIEARCVVYGGILAHYAEDMTQPLHVTVHYDGRADSTGHSPHSGLHLRVDNLPGRLDPRDLTVPADLRLTAYDRVLPAVIAEIKASNALVDHVYEIGNDFPPLEGEWTPTPAVREFGIERFRAAVRVTGSLFLTAWELSAKIHPPDWAEPGEGMGTNMHAATTRPATTRPAGK